MKTNAKKRFLSYIIAFLMVFTYIPATAYATDGENDNVTNTVTIDYDETLGTVSSNNTIITSGNYIEIDDENGKLLTAEPKDDVKFAGWMNPETGEVYSRELSYTAMPTEDITIEAVFMGTETEAYYLVGNKHLVKGFNEAMNKVEEVADKVVVLLKDDTLKEGTYTVPTGVTLLIPFNHENTLYTTEIKSIKAQTKEPAEPKAFCTLTLEDGADLIVNGSMSLSSELNAAIGDGRASGMPVGDISYLVTGEGSTVTINEGGALYAYGYIVGEGNVVAKKGATVYEIFQIEDYRGGQITLELVNASQEYGLGILPISQYYVQNIEIPLTLEAGSAEYVHACLAHSSNVLETPVPIPFIGGSSAMFSLKSGYAVKSYDSKTDRLNFDVEGDIGLSPIEISVPDFGLNVDSSDFDLPINGNITVNLNSGNSEISQDLSLLPGSQINIGEGTTCTLAEGKNVYIYDLDQWPGYVGNGNAKMIPLYFSPSRPNRDTRTEEDLEDAAIRVNGTFDASKGLIFTTTSEDKKGGGANVYSTGKGKVITINGKTPEVYQFKYNNEGGTLDLINLLPANLKNADGSYVQTLETGVGTYTYQNGQWVCGHGEYSVEEIKEPTCSEEGENLVICEMEQYGEGFGHRHIVKVPKKDHTPVIDEGTPATCKEPGKTEGSHCDVCGETIVEQEVIEPLGHDWEKTKSYEKEPTCTEEGVLAIHCLRCGTIKEDSEEPVPANGHAYKYDPVYPTCTEDGKETKYCINCDIEPITTVLPATGHNYKRVLVEPTCTEEGYTKQVCANCNDEYKEEGSEIPATSHDIAAVAAKAPDCTHEGYDAHYKCNNCNGLFSDEAGTEAIEKEAVVKDALGHEYGDIVVDKPASCTERGSQHQTCTRDGCGDVYTETLYPTGHKEDVIKGEEPTCTESGYEAGVYCTVCDAVLVEREVIDATGHTEVIDEAVAATCTTPGLTAGSHCDVCKTVLVAQTVVEAPGHTPVVDEAVEPTCTKTGLTEGSHCSVCEAVIVKQEVVETTAHTAVVDEAVAATCTEPGKTEGSHCGVCGNTIVKQEDVEALGHDIEQHDGKEATCTDAGWEPYETCKVEGCDYTTKKMIPMKDHDIKTHVEEATCTEDGYTVEYCKCGYEKIIPGEKAKGHSFTNYSESLAPKCEAAGKEKAKCDNGCGAVDVRDIPATGHTEVADAAVPATCTKTGLTAGSHCSVCDAVIVEQEVVDKLAHDTVKHEAKSPTCEEIGWDAYETCKDCDYTTYVEKPAYEHAKVQHEAKTPTCTEVGWDAYETCSRCDYTTYEEKPALGHDAVPHEAKAPTCEKVGWDAYETCSRCDYTTYEEKPALGHDPVSHEAKAPTCEKVGWDAYETCSRCDEYTTYEEKPALGHDPVPHEAKKPTCTEIGWDAYETCSRCDHTTYVEKSALGHDPVKHEAKEPTCIEIGWDAYETCSRCDYTTYDEKSALGHDSVKHEAKEATCTEAGHEAYETCTRCDYTTYVERPIVDHKYGREQYKVPTAAEDGGSFVKCSDCGHIKWIAKQTYKQYIEEGVTATTIKAEATGSVKTEQITIKWTKSEGFAVDYYKVFRSTSGKSGTYSSIGQTTSRSYVDKKATVGKTYYYKVIGYREYDGDIYETKASDAVTAKIKKVTASEVKATPMYGTTNYVNKGLQIMWTSPKIKVDGYQIYRSTSKNGTYKKVKTTKSNVYSWTNTGLKVGKRYYYKIRGYKYVNGKAVYTKFSSKGFRYVLSGKSAKLARAIVRSDAITAKKAVKVSSGIKVTWSKDTSIKCNRYEVWRATSKSGTYKKLGTTKNMYYTDKNTKKGKTYYYKIKGYRVFGKSSAKTNYSNVVSGKR